MRVKSASPVDAELDLQELVLDVATEEHRKSPGWERVAVNLVGCKGKRANGQHDKVK